MNIPSFDDINKRTHGVYIGFANNDKLQREAYALIKQDPGSTAVKTWTHAVLAARVDLATYATWCKDAQSAVMDEQSRLSLLARGDSDLADALAPLRAELRVKMVALEALESVRIYLQEYHLPVNQLFDAARQCIPQLGTPRMPAVPHERYTGERESHLATIYKSAAERAALTHVAPLIAKLAHGVRGVVTLDVFKDLVTQMACIDLVRFDVASESIAIDCGDGMTYAYFVYNGTGIEHPWRLGIITNTGDPRLPIYKSFSTDIAPTGPQLAVELQHTLLKHHAGVTHDQ